MITGMPRIAVAVRAMDAAITTFRDTFQMPVTESPNSVAALGVRIAMCAPTPGSTIELMCPANAALPLGASVQKFLDHRGEGLFALMLEAPDPDAEAAVLAGRGLQVLPLLPGSGGRDIHPRSTHGVLIRIYPTRSEPAVGAPAAPTTGIMRVVVAVRDLNAALPVYRDRLGLSVVAEGTNGETGLRFARCAPGSGGQIELVTPAAAGRPFAAAVADRLQERGEGMMALVLQADDPVGLAAVLAERGIPARPSAGLTDTIEVAPSATYGARLLIEHRR